LSAVDDSHDAYQQVESENRPEFSHEMLGGAAAFGAMKLFEDRQRKEGIYYVLALAQGK
jgi:hypothetical protein